MAFCNLMMECGFVELQVDFDLTPVTVRCDTTDSTAKKASRSSSSGYIYESDTVRRAAPPPHPVAMGKSAAAMTEPSESKDIPYHARQDSKPFTYGVVATNGTPLSPSMLRRNCKECSPPPSALESPSLVRKLSGSSLTSSATESSKRPTPRMPVPSITQPTSPRPMRKLSDMLPTNGNSESDTASPNQPVATSSPRLDAARSSNGVTSHQAASPIPHQTVSLEESIQDISTSSDASRLTSNFTYLNKHVHIHYIIQYTMHCTGLCNQCTVFNSNWTCSYS